MMLGRCVDINVNQSISRPRCPIGTRFKYMVARSTLYGPPLMFSLSLLSL